MTASGFPAPTISESGTLPEGVHFDATTGTISGTPSQDGTYHISLEASNGVGSAATQAFTLVVDSTATITSEASTSFSYGVAGTFAVTAAGYPAPSVSESGALPAGVTFDPSTGELTGTPTQRGVFDITFTAHNGVGADTVQPFTLTVLGLHVTTTSLPEATPRIPYSYQLTALGGMAKVTWHLTSGSLPKGIRLNSAGRLSGTVLSRAYPSGGSSTFTVTASDHLHKVSESAAATFTITVG